MLIVNEKTWMLIKNLYAVTINFNYSHEVTLPQLDSGDRYCQMQSHHTLYEF